MNWKLREGIIITTVCGKSFLVSSDSTGNGRISAVYVNHSAAFICRKLKDGYSPEEIKKELFDEFEIPEDTDVDVRMNELINDLEEQGYIVSAD